MTDRPRGPWKPPPVDSPDADGNGVEHGCVAATHFAIERAMYARGPRHGPEVALAAVDPAIRLAPHPDKRRIDVEAAERGLVHGALELCRRPTHLLLECPVVHSVSVPLPSRIERIGHLQDGLHLRDQVL